MVHRITITVKRTDDGDPFHVFRWLRENIQNRYWYVHTVWANLDPIFKQILVITELLHYEIYCGFDIYTDPDTRERIMTFEFDNEDDLILVRLRFNEVPLERDRELSKILQSRKTINAMLEEDGDA